MVTTRQLADEVRGVRKTLLIARAERFIAMGDRLTVFEPERLLDEGAQEAITRLSQLLAHLDQEHLREDIHNDGLDELEELEESYSGSDFLPGVAV